jgi:hypothetical protein
VLIPHKSCLAHHTAVLQLVLNWLRRHELAARGLQQFLLAIGNVEKSVLIEMGNVARAEPAFLIEAFSIGRGLVPIP